MRQHAILAGGNETPIEFQKNYFTKLGNVQESGGDSVLCSDRSLLWQELATTGCRNGIQIGYTHRPIKNTFRIGN